MISDLERDDLHREVLRTQGRLTSRTGYDALGRKAWQFASHLPADRLSSLHNPGIVVTDLIERRDNPIARRHRYDAGGELIHTWDKTRGDSHYAYDPSGRLLGRSPQDSAAREHFAYDPAANLVPPEADTPGSQVKDNRLRTWQDMRFDYDPWGNLVTKRTGRHREQRFEYDAENRLVHAATYRDGDLQNEAHYHYDSLGRRIGKVVEREGATRRTDFIWQGLRLLQVLLQRTTGRESLRTGRKSVRANGNISAAWYFCRRSIFITASNALPLNGKQHEREAHIADIDPHPGRKPDDWRRYQDRRTQD